VGTGADGQDDGHEERRSSAALLRMVGEVARIGGWAVDVRAGLVTWTEELCRIFELPQGTHQQPVGATQYFMPESLAIMRRHFAACATDGTPFDVQAEAITHTGPHVMFLSQRQLIRCADRSTPRAE